MRGNTALIARAGAVATAAGLAGLLLFPVAASAGPGVKLKGVFGIAAGQCTASAGVTSGSYFRMIEPGTPTTYLANSSSPCGDQTYTPLSPGSSGGLSTTGYQPNPTPEFDSSGNGLANEITQPTGFFGLNFAESTNPTDPQTGLPAKKPKVIDTNGTLTGKLPAWSVGWNNTNFNQGAPSLSGGTTTGPTGTYKKKTGAYTLTWTSEISGGPFNGYTGEWYLTGTFTS